MSVSISKFRGKEFDPRLEELGSRLFSAIGADASQPPEKWRGVMVDIDMEVLELDEFPEVLRLVQTWCLVPIWLMVEGAEGGRFIRGEYAHA